ncbi:protein C-terminal S-isoprenylcysteine carboxyl O-methyltransferases [Striga hermonthica]|uniref:Protein C-terminal S-isoprenylcysteine carboxyl O-methyltransferases n=1 Tax=Striga hermonthica TaxID=68872 RepID=A0A9N7MHF7_STRHE|nr:protein C-terminal S-isoprenylcysteine carboxyl O-methyltransferases [Striga hermonthica]
MDAAAASFVFPKVTPFSSTLPKSSRLLFLRHSNKHFERKGLSVKNNNPSFNSCHLSVAPDSVNPLRVGSGFPSLGLGTPSNHPRTLFPLRIFRCSVSSSAASSGPDAPSRVLDSLKSTLSELTPADVCKWSLAFCAVIAVSKWTANLLLSPFFWLYFSWTWIFWPWMVAVAVAICGCYCLRKYLKGEATEIEQLGIVTSAFTWLTLVPPAHFNGFLEGWPFVFFLVYHFFFFLHVSVRKRLYGDLYAREHDPKWDISLPNLDKILFCAGVFLAHWLAAFEGVELHLVPGGWNNLGIWVLILASVFLQYGSVLYLSKYSERVVEPTSVVHVGPYRFVRHPMYASTVLLFASYFTALRAPWSLLFLVGICLVYYGKKAKLEEALLLETFEERYSEYMARVRYRFIPFIY